MKKTIFTALLIIAGTAVLYAFLSAEPVQYENRLPDQITEKIKKDELVKLTQQLVSIRSDFGEDEAANHREIAKFLAGYLEGLGMDVKIFEPEPNFPTVIGRIKGNGDGYKFGLMGHYNTVMPGDMSKWKFDPWSAEYKNGRIYGLGAYDQKIAIAAGLIATRAFLESGTDFQGELVHLYIPGEGAQVHSLPYIVEDNPEALAADWYLDTDAMSADILSYSGGWTWVTVRTEGVAAHTGGKRADGKPGRPPNAIVHLARIITELRKVDEWMEYEKHELFPRPDYDGKPIVEIGTISGGYKVNQVPDIAEADVDIRLLPGQSPEQVLKEMRALFDRLKKDIPELKATVEPFATQWVAPHYWEKINDQDPLVKAIKKIAPAYSGRTPEFVSGLGGGRPDLWATGAIWMNFGLPGGGENMHSPNEFAEVDVGLKRAYMYAELLLEILQK